nr:hypothetical protein [Tanacetum cinerariifolium]
MLKEQKPNNSRLYSEGADKRRTFLRNVVPVQMKELVLDQGFRMYHLMTSSDDEDVDAQDEGDKNDESDDGSDDGDDDDNDETIKDVSERDDNDDDNYDEEALAKTDEPEDIESCRGGDEVTESERESDEEETRKEEKESFDPIPRTPEGSEDEGNDEEDQDLRLSEEARIQEKEEADELYRDVDINQGRGLKLSYNIEDSHVTLTPVHPDGLKESSSVSSFVTSMQNPISDAGVESIFTTASSPIVSLQTPTPIMTPSTISTITTSSDAPIPPTTIPSTILENLPTFNSVFCFDERLKSLETSFSEYRQTNPFVDTDRLQDSFQRENDEFLRNIDENMKKIIKGKVKSQVKEQVSRILPIIEESVNATLEAKVLTRSSHSSRTSYAVAANLSKMELKKILIEKMEGNKREDDDQEGPSAGSDRGSKRQREGGEHASTSTLSETATGSAGRSTIGSQSRQLSAKLEYHLEEVYKATTDQLDWVNPEGQQYPHNLLQPLPLIPDNRGCRVIPFEHFINNDLEYLWGGASSRKYTTSVTKTKAEDYGHIKWIEDLVPRVMWIHEPINYDRRALWGVSYWGRKRQQFYGFAVNQESALDVYSKRKIIAVTELKIVEWHNYKHLDWISVRRDDDKIYKFKEGDFKRLRLQDIEDIQLLLDRAATMIQAIDKMLKTRRIMRSLEKFVGGRL